MHSDRSARKMPMARRKSPNSSGNPTSHRTITASAGAPPSGGFTTVSLGQVHRLANAGKVRLESIELRSGSYLGEDDVVRFEDTYRGAR